MPPRSAAIPLVALLAAIVLATAGCGSGSGSGSGSGTVTSADPDRRTTTIAAPNVPFAKAKFVLHMGLAFGAFHRYISRPLERGAFGPRAPHRLSTVVKAGTAALFAVHELRMAHEDALSDSRLRPLALRVGWLWGSLTRLGSAMKRGTLQPSAITACASAVGALDAASGGLGVRIAEIEPAL